MTSWAIKQSLIECSAGDQPAEDNADGSFMTIAAG